MNTGKILLAHGGGGRLTDELIRSILVPAFKNESLEVLGDSAALDLPSGKLCFTTDSYVVRPLFFNGGDIGKLAVCGTVNDLAVSGSKPVALTIGLIIEEGFEIADLQKIVDSAALAAREAGVSIVAGDTKVVEKGLADGIYINTSGIGVRLPGLDLGFNKIKPGDHVLTSGTLGDHGMTIMSQREGIKFQSVLKSDCAPLNGIISDLCSAAPAVRFMRDATRGGLAAVLNEIASASGLSIVLDQAAIPVNPTVQAAADMLGLDILNIANEGKFVAIVDPAFSKKALDALRSHPLGQNAALIGTVTQSDEVPLVEMKTSIGGSRIIQMPYGRELPRIC